MDVINLARVGVWKNRPPEFFQQARIDADNTLAAADRCCKQGVDISYNGLWSYRALLVSLANTEGPLFLLNRPGNRPSDEDAAGYLDRAIDLTLGPGFKSVQMRGDTGFLQATHLYRWDALDNATFLFGLDTMAQLSSELKRWPPCWAELAHPPPDRVTARFLCVGWHNANHACYRN